MPSYRCWSRAGVNRGFSGRNAAIRGHGYAYLHCCRWVGSVAFGRGVEITPPRAHVAPVRVSDALRLVPYDESHFEKTVAWLNLPDVQAGFEGSLTWPATRLGGVTI